MKYFITLFTMWLSGIVTVLSFMVCLLSFLIFEIIAVDIFYQSFVVMVCGAVVTIASAAIMIVLNYLEIEGRYK